MADEIRATPRNQLLGLLADALQSGSNFASKPFGYDNPPVRGLLDLLGVPAVTNTLNELSYGGALGTGSGMTYRPKADTLDAAMAVAPLLGGAPRAINAGAAAIGRRLEPSVNALVNRAMVQGGRPAQMLQDLAQGTTSNVIYHPFLKPSIAFSHNPYAGLSGPDASNMTRYLAKLRNPEFSAREMMREGGNTNSQTIANSGINLVTPEDWYRAGNPLAATAGDTSLAGKRFTSVEGVPLLTPVDGQGGFEYTLQNLGRGSDNAWSSMEQNAQGKQNHFDKVAIETGQTPRSVFFGMNPEDSADFSTPITEMIMGQLGALPPSPKAVVLANEMMRKEYPNFVGVEHPQALDQLMGRNGFPQEGAGALRKQFAWASKQKSLDSLGWPSYEDARDTITHPLLKNSNVGDSGLSSFLTNPGADLIGKSGHNSYNRGISGTNAQSLPVSIPAQNMFPDIYEAGKLKRNRAGNPFTHDQIIGDIKMGHSYQIPNQMWLDQIMPVFESEHQRALLTNGLLSP